MLAIPDSQSVGALGGSIIELTDWAVTVLGDDEVCNILDFWVVGFVISRAINKTHDVGVLLNGTGFTQVS